MRELPGAFASPHVKSRENMMNTFIPASLGGLNFYRLSPDVIEGSKCPSVFEILIVIWSTG
jgi:hypothetical protein